MRAPPHSEVVACIQFNSTQMVAQGRRPAISAGLPPPPVRHGSRMLKCWAESGAARPKVKVALSDFERHINGVQTGGAATVGYSSAALKFADEGLGDYSMRPRRYCGVHDCFPRREEGGKTNTDDRGQSMRLVLCQFLNGLGWFFLPRVSSGTVLGRSWLVGRFFFSS